LSFVQTSDYTALRSFAYNLTKNDEDAKDLYQETAFRAMTNRDKFRTGTNFKGIFFARKALKEMVLNYYGSINMARTSI